MSEFLFIRPNLSEKRKYLWFSYDDVSKNILAQGEVESLFDLENIKEYSQGRAAVLLYPTEACKLNQLTYPTRLRKSEINALLYQIEDDFSEDVDKFSVHVLNRDSSNYDVLIYKTEELKSIENALSLMGFSVEHIIPDVLALPLGTKVNDSYDITVMELDNSFLFRTGPYSGFMITRDLLPFIGDKLLDKNVVSLTQSPENYKELWIEELCENSLSTIAEGALKSKVNLSISHQKKYIQFKHLKSWMLIAFLFICVTSAWYINIDYRIKALMKETNAYKNSQRSLFSEIMPNTGRARDPVYAFKQYISKTSGIGTDEGYIDLVNMISPKILENKNLEMVSMKFSRKTKTFIVHYLAPNDFDMEKFASPLSENFIVELQTAKPSRDKMLYSVLLRRVK